MGANSKGFKTVAMAITLALACSLSLPAYSQSPKPTVEAAGKTLKLLGRGLREFLFIDIYTLDAYSESGACAPGKIVYNTEVKLMRLTLIRKIPVKRLQSAVAPS